MKKDVIIGSVGILLLLAVVASILLFGSLKPSGPDSSVFTLGNVIKTNVVNVDTSTTSSGISVPGMSKYTDADFGFSFWYPTPFIVKEVPVIDPNEYAGGVIEKEFILANAKGGSEFIIDEYHTPDHSFTSNQTCDAKYGCSLVERVYFDTSTNQWMNTYPEGHPAQYKDQPWYIPPGHTEVAYPSHTIGGLPALNSTGPLIIPLTHQDFVLITEAKEATVNATTYSFGESFASTDPTIGKPDSVADQTHEIELEGVDFGFDTFPPIDISSISSPGLPIGEIYSGGRVIISGAGGGCDSIRPNCDLELWIGDKAAQSVADPNQLVFIAPQIDAGTYDVRLDTDVAHSKPLKVKVISPSTAGDVSVPGMTKYTDSDFGFSFWYPSGWKVTEDTISKPKEFIDGTVQKQLLITVPNSSSAHLYQDITIKEYTSPQLRITIPGWQPSCTCGPIDDTTYYFNSSGHTWMALDNGSNVGAADISQNTMGGLHVLHVYWGGQLTGGVPAVIPLSARNFVVIDGTADDWGGPPDPMSLVKTILATDPSVATPVDSAEQIATIQSEKNAYTGQ